MKQILQQLQQLGFGDYEARAYVALLKRNPLNGYELAKASGIPRGNVYGVLQKLEERGAVVRVETPAGARYSPVAPSELIQRLGARYKDILERTQDSLDRVATPAEHAYVWNTRGYTAMVEHAQALLNQAHERVLIAAWPQETRALAENLAGAQARGVEELTLCLNDCANECGNCRGHIYRFSILPPQPSRWLILVVDAQELLASEIGQGDEVLTVRTRQKLFVDVASWYIRHSIALAAVVNDLGDRLDGLLQPETRAILQTVGPEVSSGGWLEEMRELLSQEPSPVSTLDLNVGERDG